MGHIRNYISGGKGCHGGGPHTIGAFLGVFDTFAGVFDVYTSIIEGSYVYLKDIHKLLQYKNGDWKEIDNPEFTTTTVKAIYAEIKRVEDNHNELSARVAAIGINPIEGYYPTDGSIPINGVWFVKTGLTGRDYFHIAECAPGYYKGDYNIYLEDGGVRARQDVVYRLGNELFRYDGETLEKIGEMNMQRFIANNTLSDEEITAIWEES